MSYLDFSDLETLPADLETRKAKPEQAMHKCEKCGGSGTVTWGYIHMRSGKCFKCNGTGHFKTSAATRQAQRQKRHQREASKSDDNWAAFVEDQPAAAEWLTSARGEFPTSLKGSVRKYGSLTEKQLAAVHKCIARDADRAEQKEAKAEQTQVDMADLLHRFSLALEAGIKRPKVNVGDLLFSLAPASGKNAGHVYVKGEKDAYGERTYLGKISPEGKLYTSRDCTDEQEKQIVEIGSDVIKAAKAHGAQHSNCCFCNKDLNTNESVANGYGPVCADKYGLPWDVTPEFLAAKAALREANQN